MILHQENVQQRERTNQTVRCATVHYNSEENKTRINEQEANFSDLTKAVKNESISNWVYILCCIKKKKLTMKSTLMEKRKVHKKTLKIKVVLLHIILVHHKQFFFYMEMNINLLKRQLPKCSKKFYLTIRQVFKLYSLGDQRALKI